MLHGKGIQDIGHMDRVIEIYSRQDTETDFGSRKSYVLLSTEWAEEIPKTRTMREEVMGGKEASIQETHWRIRKETPVTTKNTIKSDGYYYDIITILREGRDYQVLVTQLRPDSQNTEWL